MLRQHASAQIGWHPIDAPTVPTRSIAPGWTSIDASRPFLDARLLTRSYRYLDVRTPTEFAEGHAPCALNMPFMNASASGMVPNPGFLAGVAAQVPDKSAQLLVGCKSGARSNKAATALSDAGYAHIIDVEGGFDAWKACNMPVEK